MREQTVEDTQEGPQVTFFHGIPCVEFEAACEKNPGLREWMVGQTGLGPVDGKCYIYLFDYDRFLSGRKVID
jgi:hypothetical protein